MNREIIPGSFRFYWHPLAGQSVPTYLELPLLLASLGSLARLAGVPAVHVEDFHGNHVLDVLPAREG